MEGSAMESSYSFNYSFFNGTGLDCKAVLLSYLPSIIFIGVISLLGVVANIGLLVITCSNKSLRSPSSIFLINVIGGDLIYLLIRAPIFMRKLMGPFCWTSGLFACKAHWYAESVAQYVCVLSLTALSIERYMAVVRGLESRQLSSRNCKVWGVLLTWALSTMLAIPTALHSTIHEMIPICTATSYDMRGLLYDVYRILTMYLIPLFVISTLYISIALTLYRSSHTMLNNTRQDANNRRQTSQRRRLAMIFVLITVSFAVLWLPHFFAALFMQVMNSKTEADMYYNKHLMEIATISALLNAALDPYIVFAMSTVYRKSLSKCCHKQSRYCCEKGEHTAMNSMGRSNNSSYHRPSVTLSTSLRAPQTTFVDRRRNSPSAVNTDTAL